jgi:hypothetical protein
MKWNLKIISDNGIGAKGAEKLVKGISILKNLSTLELDLW